MFLHKHYLHFRTLYDRCFADMPKSLVVAMKIKIKHFSLNYYALSPWEFQKRFLEDKWSYAVQELGRHLAQVSKESMNTQLTEENACP